MGEEEVPQEIICSGCGYNLYEGDVLKSPQDIIKKYDGRCPRCNKKLDFSSTKVDVTPSVGKGSSSG